MSAAAVLLVGFLLPTAASAGTVALGPDLEPAEQFHDIVRFRYKARVDRDTATTLKVIYSARRLYNPDCVKDCETYLLEANLYTYWIKYLEKACIVGEPAGAGVTRFGQTGLWMSVPDYNKHGFIGARQLDNPTKSLFPRQTIGLDPVQGISKIETITQMDVTGKALEIEFSRGDTFTFPLEGWGHRWEPDQDINPDHTAVPMCRPSLPEGRVYRRWAATVHIGYRPYRLEFALPDESARFLAPWEMLSITTASLEKTESEAARRVGDFRAYFWDLEFQREHETAWRPLTKLKVFTLDDPEAGGGSWGVTLGRFRSRTVLEVGNVGRGPYFRLNDKIDLGLK